MRKWSFWTGALIMLMGLLACGLSAEAVPSPVPTDGTIALTFAPVVTMTNAANPANGASGATAEGTASAGELAVASAELCGGQPTDSAAHTDSAPSLFPISARYDADVRIEAAARQVSAVLKARYRNRTGAPLSTVVFHIDANRTPGLFTLDSLVVDAAASLGGPYQITQQTLNGPRLEVTLAAPLRPGCAIGFRLAYTLKVPALENARMRYLSYTDRQINLGYWLPEIAPRLNGEWYTPKAHPVGEYTVSDLAAFDVNVVVNGEGEAIGPGTAARLGDHNWRFTLPYGRSFTLVISTALARLNTRTADGLMIDLYYFAKGDPKGAPGHALTVARESAERYTELFGKLPFDRLVIVEGDFPDGMESSGIVHVSHQWFAGWKGNLDSWLTLITVHEVAHQWWYVLINNDQGRWPYLDESLALYSEVLYLEAKQPDLVPWWWTFRVRMYQPRGFVDSSVYEYWNSRLYINAVYLRAASMIQEIRDLIGNEAFFGWLRRYLAAVRGQIATPADYWGALGPDGYARTAEIRQKYLKSPNVLPVDTAQATAAATGSASDGVAE